MKSVHLWVFFMYGIGTIFAENCHADVLDNWHWRAPYPQGNDLHAACHGNGIFVLVGDAGSIVTSQDGTNWQNQVSRTNSDLFGLTFASGNFVAVGSSGAITLSPDALSWSLRDSGTTNLLSGIAGSDTGTLVAVGQSGTIALSTNSGSSWSPQPSGTTRQLSGVAFGSGQFVAVGANGNILSSTKMYRSAKMKRIKRLQRASAFATVSGPGYNIPIGGWSFG